MADSKNGLPFQGSFLLGTTRTERLQDLAPPPQPLLERHARDTFQKLKEDLAALAEGKPSHRR